MTKVSSYFGSSNRFHAYFFFSHFRSLSLSLSLWCWLLLLLPPIESHCVLVVLFQRHPHRGGCGTFSLIPAVVTEFFFSFSFLSFFLSFFFWRDQSLLMCPLFITEFFSVPTARGRCPSPTRVLPSFTEFYRVLPSFTEVDFFVAIVQWDQWTGNMGSDSDAIFIGPGWPVKWLELFERSV